MSLGDSAALVVFFFSSRRRHTRCSRDWSSDVCSSDLALQGLLAAVLALAGTYEVLLRYVVAIDFIFFALTASCVFVFRGRGEAVEMPGHPVTTLAFIGVCAAVVISTFVQDPVHSLFGLALTLAGLPVYLLWRRKR